MVSFYFAFHCSFFYIQGCFYMCCQVFEFDPSIKQGMDLIPSLIECSSFQIIFLYETHFFRSCSGKPWHDFKELFFITWTVGPDWVIGYEINPFPKYFVNFFFILDTNSDKFFFIMFSIVSRLLSQHWNYLKVPIFLLGNLN